MSFSQVNVSESGPKVIWLGCEIAGMMICFRHEGIRVFFLVHKYILQLYYNEFEIQRLAAAHCDSVCIRKSIRHFSAGVCSRSPACDLQPCINIFMSTSTTNQKMITIRASFWSACVCFKCQVVSSRGLAVGCHAGGLFAVFCLESQPGRQQTPAAGSCER